MTRRLALAALLLGLAVPAAQADVVFDPARTRSAQPSMSLVSVEVASGDAPAGERDLVRRDAERALAGRRRRIQRCLSRSDLREDPLRSRERYVEGTLTFDRSPRGRLALGRGVGIPRVARACLAEAARSVRVRTTPHGRVVLRVRYVLR